MIHQKKINTILERMNSVNNQEDFFSIFKDICYEFNIEKFALAIFSGKKNILESFCIYDTYPEAWKNRYNEKQYHMYDPVFANLKKIALPFEWSTQSFDTLLPVQQMLMKEAYDFGIKSGVTIPLIPHAHFQGFVTLLNQPPLHPEVLYTLSLVANACTDKIISSYEQKSMEHLTEREIEILTLKSQGFPIKAISHTLGISSPTITFHLKNIRKKLDTQSTEQSLFKFASVLNNN